MTALYLLPDVFFQLLLPMLPGLETLGQWAVSASVLILLVLGVRLLLRGRLSCRFVYALWAVVLVRLLLPFQLSIPLPVSAAGAAPNVPAVWEETQVPLFPSLPQDMEDVNSDYQTLEPGYSGPGPGSQGYVERSEDGETVTLYLDSFTWSEILRLVWGIGVLAALLLILVPNLRFAIHLEERRRTLEVSDCPLPVYEAEGLPSPCLFGLFRPAIYLTPEAAQLPEGQQRHILAHELTHYYHKDHLWAVLRCLALVLHWYNPLVWLAVICSKRDGELACDEGTVLRLGEGERIPYGRTLVDLVARRSLRPGDLISCSTAMTGGNKTIQQRIAQLVKKPETKKTALFAAAALVALAALFTFGGGTQDRTLSREGFLTSLEEARSVTLALPTLSDYTFGPIADEDLLTQVRELLGQAEAYDQENAVSFGFQDMASSSHTVSFTSDSGSTAFCLYAMEGGGEYVLAKLDDTTLGAEPLAVLPQGTISQLEELARQQQERNQSITRVEYPEFKAALTELFLGDEECVERNGTGGYDMEEWLTNSTSFYEISHAAPWWLEGAEEGWYARAMDAGSWYSISIPDHLVPQVQAICEEQALYPSLDTIYSALEQIDTIYYTAMSAMSFHSVIRDLETLDQITQLLLTPQGNMAQVSDPGRVTMGEEFGVLTIPVDEEHSLTLCLQEVEGGCLLSCGRADDTWSDTQPVLWTLPAGTAQKIYDLYEDWLAGQNQSDSAPGYDWQGELALDALAPGDEVLSPSPVTVPADGGGFTYYINYQWAGLTLELGLRAPDGTEYCQRAVGGSLAGTIPDIPAGTHQLFVRNSGDYDFQTTGDLKGDVDDYATGTLVFLVEASSDETASPNL